LIAHEPRGFSGRRTADEIQERKMRKYLYVSCAAVVMLGLHAAAFADCGCKTAKVEGGWCDDCEVGYFNNVKIKSHKLHEALAGKEVDAHAVKCDACKQALERDGSCEGCQVSFAHKKAYRSPVAHKLMVGKAHDVSEITCAGCKKGAGTHPAWCKSCNVGWVGNVTFSDKSQWTEARAARKILVKAAAKKCDGCAVAMVTDGTCSGCKVSFKDGKPAKKTADEKATP
jgi:hypothetical protein